MKHIELTDNEHYLLKQLVWDIEHGLVGESGVVKNPEIKLTLPEMQDLRSISRKLFHAGIKTEDHHAEGLFT